MIAQTVLPFKLEMTNDTLTSQAGLVLFGEFLKALGLDQVLGRELEKPGSARGYAPSRHVLPLVLMLTGGGRSLEDLRQIREDTGLRELLGWRELPSADAVGDWLRRQGEGEGLRRLGRVGKLMLRRALELEPATDYTLDIDASQIVAEKIAALWTYKGEKGYMPILGTLAENGLILGEEFREGNVAPADGNLEFIKYCTGRMPAGKRIGALRADAASYQAGIFNWCEAHKVVFAIGARQAPAVKAAIASIPESEWRPYQDGHIAETVHCMEKTKKAFRLIVIRRPVQQELFTQTGEAAEKEEQAQARYHAVASNRAGESAGETLAWYHQRGEHSENRIKEVKIGFGQERMPCGQFQANAMFFRIGCLAYNLFVMFKRQALPREFWKAQVQTLRWRFFSTAGKVVFHAGAVVLKVGRFLFSLFEEVRQRCWEVCQVAA